MPKKIKSAKTPSNPPDIPIDKKREKSATSIQNAFRASQVRKGLEAAGPDLRQAIEGNSPVALTDLVGKFYAEAGLVRKTKKPVNKSQGRLAGDWSGGVATQKKRLTEFGAINLAKALDPIGTTHHTVSDHFLGFLNEGIARLETGDDTAKAAADKFRTQIATDSLYSPQGLPASDSEKESRHQKALYQVRQNLTFGPLTESIKNDPGSGFDPTFKPITHDGLARDWDTRSTALRPVHNIAWLVKSGNYKLTSEGAEHLSTQFSKARTEHDKDLIGSTYKVETKRQAKGGAFIPKVTSHQQTIPVHGVQSGHFDATPIQRKNSAAPVPGFTKKKWK